MASHRGQPGKFMCDLRSTKYRWDKFSPSTSVFPYPNHSILYTHLHLHVAVTRKTNGQNLGTFEEAKFFGNRGALDGQCAACL